MTLLLKDIMQLRAAQKRGVELPDLYVHDHGTWSGKPVGDSKARIHMNKAQMLGLSRQIPIKRIARIGPTTVLYRFDLTTEQADNVRNTVH